MSTFAQRSRALAIAALLAVVAALGFAFSPGGVAQADEPALTAASPVLAQGEDATTYTLQAINEERMWKVVQVEVEDNASGQDYMTVYVTSAPSSYPFSFVGTQDEAAASFTGKETDDRWVIAPEEKTFDPAVSYGTWDGATATATVGYGHRYPITIPDGQAKFTQDVIFYSDGQSSFTARRIDIDLDSMTATCGSGHAVASVAVDASSVADIAASAEGSIDYTGYVVTSAGSQNQEGTGLSNDWKSMLTVKLADNSVYDKAYAVKHETAKPADYDSTLGTVVAMSDGDLATVAVDGTLALPVFNDYNSSPKTKQLNRNEIKVMMHVAETAAYEEAGTWVERSFTLDFTSRTEATLTITGDVLTPVKYEPIPYDGDSYKLVKNDLTSTFGMLSPNPADSLKVTRYNGKIRVEYTPKNTKTYSGIYLDADIRLQDTWSADNLIPITQNADLVFLLDESYAGKAWPIAPVKPDGGTTSAQYYMAIPTLDKISEFAIEDGVYALSELAAGPSAMFNHLVADSGTLKVQGETATLMFCEDGSTASVGKYSRLALGKSSELLTANYQPDSVLPAGTTIVEGVKAGEGTEGDKWAFAVPLSKERATELLFYPDEKLYVTVWNNVGSSADKIPGWYKASNDIYLTFGTFGDAAADYTNVFDALAGVPANLAIYTDETVDILTDVIDAVVWGKGATEQEAVGAMASDIEAAVNGLKNKTDELNEAVAALPSSIDEITADNVSEVEAALEAYSALTDEQKGEVDAATAAKLIAASIKAAEVKVAVAAEEAAAKAAADATAAAERTDLSGAAVTVKGATYTGKALTPAVTVKLGTQTLRAGADYEVSYASNTAAGTGVAVVKGVGKYAGAATGTFAIAKAANPLATKAAAKSLKAATLKKKAQSFKPAVVKAKGQGALTYAKKKVTAKYKKYVTVAKGGKVTLKKGAPKGKCVVTLSVKAAGNANYKAATKTVKVTITVK